VRREVGSRGSSVRWARSPDVLPPALWPDRSQAPTRGPAPRPPIIGSATSGVRLGTRRRLADAQRLGRERTSRSTAIRPVLACTRLWLEAERRNVGCPCREPTGAGGPLTWLLAVHCDWVMQAVSTVHGVKTNGVMRTMSPPPWLADRGRDGPMGFHC